MNQVVYGELTRVAQSRTTTTYGAIAPMVGLDLENPAHRNDPAHMLGEISRRENENGRPLLSAVVVLQDTFRPGKGFFTLARELGLHSGDDEAFFSEELKRVWDTWE